MKVRLTLRLLVLFFPLLCQSGTAVSLPTSGTLIQTKNPGSIDYTLDSSFSGELYFSLDKLTPYGSYVSYSFGSGLPSETRDLILTSDADKAAGKYAYFDFSGRSGLVTFQDTLENVVLENGKGHQDGDSRKGGAFSSINTEANKNLDTGVVFRNSGDVIIQGNRSEAVRGDSLGGGMYAEYSSLRFLGTNENNVTFQNNLASTQCISGGAGLAKGGAVAVCESSSLIFGSDGGKLGTVSFIGNKALAAVDSSSGNWGVKVHGGAIYCEYSSEGIQFHNTGNILFSGNVAQATVTDKSIECNMVGGAIGTQNSIVFDKTGDIVFEGNQVLAEGKGTAQTSGNNDFDFEIGGGALGKDYLTNGTEMSFSFSDTGDVSFIRNQVIIDTEKFSALCQANGGAILGQNSTASASVATSFQGKNALRFVENEVLVQAGESLYGAVAQARGGAIMLTRSNLDIKGYSNVVFIGNKASTSIGIASGSNITYGGAVYVDMYNGYSSSSFSLTDIQNLLFSGNEVSAVSRESGKASAYGGAIAVYSGGTAANSITSALQGKENAVFEKNRAFASGVNGQCIAYGGVLYMYTKGANSFTIDGFRNISFTGNGIKAASDNGSSYSFGGGIYSSGVHEIRVEAGVNLSFTGNEAVAESTGGMASSKGGLIYGSSDLDFSLKSGQALIIEGNMAQSSNMGSGDAYANGGAISTAAGAKLTLSAPGISISGNKAVSSAVEGDAEAYGGALYVTGMELVFDQAQAWSMTGNSAWASSEQGEAYAAGGAVYANDSTLVFHADSSDIVLSGNTISTDGGKSLIANSLFMSDAGGVGALHLGAREGYSVVMGDSVKGDYTDSANLSLKLNEREQDLGRIVFTGRYNESVIGSADTELLRQSAESDLNAAITLFHGELVLEEGAMLGCLPEAGAEARSAINTGASYTQYAATLDIDHATLAAETMTFAAGYDSVIRPGSEASLQAGHIDLESTGGFSVDLVRYLPVGAEAFLDLGGIAVKADTLNMTNGVTGIVDNAKIDYYLDKRWASSHRFALFNISEVGNKDDVAAQNDVSSAQSNKYTSSRVEGVGEYKGTWTREVEDDVVYLVWNPDPGQEPVEPDNPEQPDEMIPEMAGNLTENTLWSSSSNLKTLTGISLGMASEARIRNKVCRNLWALGLGDFSRHDSQGHIDGYHYNGGGYAVGADTTMGCRPGVFGFSFGQMLGTNYSDRYSARVKQDTLMAGLYAGYVHDVAPGKAWIFQGNASFGNTANRLRTWYSDGDYSSARWHNRVWEIDLKASFRTDLNSYWSVAPHGGLEYAGGNRESFTEAGGKPRQFDSSDLSRLSIPVGVELINSSTLYGLPWRNSLDVAYVYDAVRDNPRGTATNLEYDRTWTAYGVRPDRSAVRVSFNTRLEMTPQWALYAGYRLDGTSGGVWHQANLGVSYGF